MTISMILKELWRGKDSYRIAMNAECSRFELCGRTIDVGGGDGHASYHRFFKRAPGVSVESLDLGVKTSASGGLAIDLERDRFPYADASIDTVLLFNILEHVYAYPALLAETRRILKPGGKVYGAVPFLVGYHPDPHDYWRFTREALERIFAEYEFRLTEIHPFGAGPFVASFSQVEWIFLRFLRWIPYSLARMADAPLLRLRPSLREKFALGLFFNFSK